METLTRTPDMTDEQWALALIDAAIAERGAGFRYREAYPEDINEFGDTTCRYFGAGGKGKCVWGKAAELIGLTNMDDAEDEVISANDHAYVYFGITDTKVVNAMHEAQRAQDSGDTWGKAREELVDALSR